MGDPRCDSRQQQFPEPTNIIPASSYAITINPETRIPENRFQPELLHRPNALLQHPQAYCSEVERALLSPLMAAAKTPKAEVEAVAELIVILNECMGELNSTKSREQLLMKFFSEIEKEASLERFIVQRLKQSKVGAISELLEKLPEESLGGGQVNSEEMSSTETTRGLHESVEELSNKLERFKVKALDLGTVVKEEKK